MEITVFFYSVWIVHTGGGEGGIWTLAPVSRPTPLAGAPLRPLEYFSPTAVYYDFFAFRRSRQTHVLLYKTFFDLSTTFFIYFFTFFRLLYMLFPIYFSILYLVHFYRRNRKTDSKLRRLFCFFLYLFYFLYFSTAVS